MGREWEKEMLMKYSDKLKALWAEIEEENEPELKDSKILAIEILLNFYCDMVKEKKYCGGMRYSALISAQKLFDSTVKGKEK